MPVRRDERAVTIHGNNTESQTLSPELVKYSQYRGSEALFGTAPTRQGREESWRVQGFDVGTLAFPSARSDVASRCSDGMMLRAPRKVRVRQAAKDRQEMAVPTSVCPAGEW